MPRRTHREAQQTRLRILDAASLAFSSNGVSTTSLEDVARRAGVTRGAVYWHFKNKRALLAELLGSIRFPIEHFEEEGTLREACDNLTTALLETARSRSIRRVLRIILCKVEWTEAQQYAQRRIVRVRRQMDAYLMKVLSQALARGELKPNLTLTSLSLLADAFQVAIVGLLYEFAQPRPSLRDELRVKSVMCILYQFCAKGDAAKNLDYLEG